MALELMTMKLKGIHHYRCRRRCLPPSLAAVAWISFLFFFSSSSSSSSSTSSYVAHGPGEKPEGIRVCVSICLCVLYDIKKGLASGGLLPQYAYTQAFTRSPFLFSTLFFSFLLKNCAHHNSSSRKKKKKKKMTTA